MNKSIGIIGCGWLGLPLAASLVKKGCQVSGSTTSEEKIITLSNNGIVPFIISLSEDEIMGDISKFLSQIDVLIINVPPKLRGSNPENYVKKMLLLHQELQKSKVRKIIFISSTSVYGSCMGDVFETTTPQPSTESGKQLLATENLFRSDTNLQTTIIRFGGLIGPNRHPITMLSAKKELSNGNHPINLIHLHDCIKIIEKVVANSWWNETLNGVYPDHPSKQNYYTSEAERRGLPPPNYKTDTTLNGKTIHAKVLLNVKEFKFTTSL